jgi:hypothetical protein
VLALCQILDERKVHTSDTPMRNVVHTRRTSFTVAAFVLAVALLVTVPLTRETGEASATAVPELVEAHATTTALAPVPHGARVGEQPVEAAHAASMLLVGTLLIGIGSVVRRVC